MPFSLSPVAIIVLRVNCEKMGSDRPASRIDGHTISKTLEKKIQRKKKRFQHMIRNETGIECYDIPKKVQLFSVADVSFCADTNFVLTAFRI